MVGAPLDLSIDELRELCCRAIDAAGNVQPLTPAWNVGGYTNNAARRGAVVA